MKKPLNGGYCCGFLFNPRKLIISRLCSYSLSSLRSMSKISLVFSLSPSGVLFIVISASSFCTSSDTSSLHLSSLLQQTKQHHSLTCMHRQKQGRQIFQVFLAQQCKSRYSSLSLSIVSFTACCCGLVRHCGNRLLSHQVTASRHDSPVLLITSCTTA